MNARELVERFRGLESEIAAERGGFVLFALFMREDVPDRWDLIVSAPWVGRDKDGAVGFLADQIKLRLGEQDLTNLSRIVFVNPDDPRVESLNRAFGVEHGSVEIANTHVFGLPIKHAYIITSKRPPKPVEK